MVPQIGDSLKRMWRACVASIQAWLRAIAAQLWLLASLAAVWALAVVLPAVAAYPAHGLDRPAMLLLLGLAPAAASAATAWRRPWLTWTAGVGSCLPAVVACPPLLASPPLHPWSSALLALALVASVDAVLRRSGVVSGLLQLWPRPATWRDRLHTALGISWLLLAWWAPPSVADEGARSVRLLSAGLCWALVDLQASRPGRASLPALLVRRGGWLLLCGVLLWRWQQGA